MSRMDQTLNLLKLQKKNDSDYWSMSVRMQADQPISIEFIDESNVFQMSFKLSPGLLV